MPVADAPDDDEVRETYNFAPGSHGLVYRADVPDYGAGNNHHRQDAAADDAAKEDDDPRPQVEDPKETKYKLQAMKWGVWGFLEIFDFALTVPRAEIMQQGWFLSGPSAIQTTAQS